jgi:endonuclease-3
MTFVEKLLPLLRKHWPHPVCEVNHKNPLQLMVGVILSAQSTDRTVNEITPTLFKRYPTAKAFAESNPLELEQMIYRTGFFRAKAKSVREACKMIVEKFGGQVPKTMEELLELPGIGRKSANVVLGAGYGITSGIVVDTHMIRLSNRFGLSKSEDPVKIEQDLMKVVPKKDWVYFSQSMVLHGRYICVARTPHCSECYLVKICPFSDKFFEPPTNENGVRKTITGVPIRMRQ